MEEALIYVRKVMQIFPFESPQFKLFSKIMADFEKGLLTDPANLLSPVRSLFEGHNDLIDGFTQFLPENHGAAASSTASPPPPSSSKIIYSNEAGSSCSRDQRTMTPPPPSSSKIIYSNEAGSSCSRDQRTMTPPPPSFTKINSNEAGSSCSRDQRTMTPPHSSDNRRKLVRSIEFLNGVRKELENDEMYRKFLEALSEYGSHKDINFLEQKVSNIFQEKPQFYISFTGMIVDIYEAKYKEEEAKEEKKEEIQYLEFMKKKPMKKSGIMQV